MEYDNVQILGSFITQVNKRSCKRRVKTCKDSLTYLEVESSKLLFALLALSLLGHVLRVLRQLLHVRLQEGEWELRRVCVCVCVWYRKEVLAVVHVALWQSGMSSCVCVSECFFLYCVFSCDLIIETVCVCVRVCVCVC